MAWWGQHLKINITSSAYPRTLTEDVAACCMMGDMTEKKRVGTRDNPVATLDKSRGHGRCLPAGSSALVLGTGTRACVCG